MHNPFEAELVIFSKTLVPNKYAVRTERENITSLARLFCKSRCAAAVHCIIHAESSLVISHKCKHHGNTLKLDSCCALPKQLFNSKTQNTRHELIYRQRTLARGFLIWSVTSGRPIMFDHLPLLISRPAAFKQQYVLVWMCLKGAMRSTSTS